MLYPWQMLKVQISAQGGPGGALMGHSNAHPSWVQQGCMGAGLEQLGGLLYRWVKMLFSELFTEYAPANARIVHCSYAREISLLRSMKVSNMSVGRWSDNLSQGYADVISKVLTANLESRVSQACLSSLLHYRL